MKLGIVIDNLPAAPPISTPCPFYHQLNLPKGPSISTVLLASLGANRAFFFATGCSILNVTSGGMESGAEPMWEARGVEEEKDLAGKAGRRNEGRDIEGGEAIARSRPFKRVFESIVYCW
jgi:hypothetical protein